MSSVKYDEKSRTFDCGSSLGDNEVLDFCRNGYLIFENIISDDTNKKTLDYLKGISEVNPLYIPDNFTLDKLKMFKKIKHITISTWIFIPQTCIRYMIIRHS